MKNHKKKILVLTGGGDCPGLNAVIRAISKTARQHGGYEVWGSVEAFNGVMKEKPELIKLNKNLKKISIPYEARIVLPAIWGDDDLLAVPHIEYYNPDIIGLSSELEIKWMPRVAVGPVRFGLGKF